MRTITLRTDEPKSLEASIESTNQSAETVQRVSSNKDASQKLSFSVKSKNRLMVIANRLLELVKR